MDAGESDHEALRREVAEELGLDDFELGQQLWHREHEFDAPLSFRGQRERCYLVRVEPVRARAEARARGRARHRSPLVGRRRAPALVGGVRPAPPARARRRAARVRRAVRAARAREVAVSRPPRSRSGRRAPPS
ncbi:MAG: NUDIX domain-containing protein [Gaiellaceae bacterium]